MSENHSKTKPGRRRGLCGQSREILINVYLYLNQLNEKSNCTIPVMRQVSQATGISKSTVKRVISTYNKYGFQETIKSPKRTISRPPKIIIEFSSSESDCFDREMEIIKLRGQNSWSYEQ